MGRSFCNVMIEAMACGTPVVAYKRGSVPEVVEQEISGFYTDDASQMAELILSASKLNRKKVREYAQEKFS